MQYSGDEPPSLQELVDSGQLPKEALEAEVIFERVGSEGVVQSPGPDQRTVTAYQDQHESGGLHVLEAKGVSAGGGGEMAVTEGQIEVQMEKTVLGGGQTIVAGGDIEVR